MVTGEVVTGEEAGIVVALDVKTMDTGGLQGGPHRHIEVVVVITLLQDGLHHRIEVVVAAVITHHHQDAHHLTMVADQEGNEQDHLLHILLTGVLKGTMLVAR